MVAIRLRGTYLWISESDLKNPICICIRIWQRIIRIRIWIHQMQNKYIRIRMAGGFRRISASAYTPTMITIVSGSRGQEEESALHDNNKLRNAGERRVKEVGR